MFINIDCCMPVSWPLFPPSSYLLAVLAVISSQLPALLARPTVSTLTLYKYLPHTHTPATPATPINGAYPRPLQPPSSPILYRTAWHSSLFPNDLVLKICIHEDDRKHVLPTRAALDSRGCFLVVAPRGSPPAIPAPAPAPTPVSTPASSTSRRAPEIESNGKWRAPLSTPLHAMPSTPSSAAARAAAAAAAAVVANAKASAAVAAAKEAQAVAAAAAADEALLVAKASHASVAVPWTWRESEVGVRDRDGMRVLRRTPEGVLNRRAQQQQEGAARRGLEGSSSGSSSRRTPEGGGARRTPDGGNARRTPEGSGRRTPEEKSVRRSPESLPSVLEGMRVTEEKKPVVADVFVWKGSQSNRECANGVRWRGFCLRACGVISSTDLRWFDCRRSSLFVDKVYGCSIEEPRKTWVHPCRSMRMLGSRLLAAGERSSLSRGKCEMSIVLS